MIKLSIAIITFNEERNIERCLKSVVPVADEIVVVDSLSTDKTKEICEKYPVKFISNPFPGHVEQKNFAASKCSNDYVLSLDADEALSPELLKSIDEVKANWDADGYSFNRATHFCGQFIKRCGWYPDPSLRLWDRRKGAWGGDNPHDRYILQPNTVRKHLKGNLLHYSYHSLEDHVIQSNKFSTISARSKFNKGKRSSLFKIWLNPKFRFFRDYILKRGFLDGFNGYLVCKNNAHEVFLKYSKLYQLQQKKNDQID